MNTIIISTIAIIISILSFILNYINGKLSRKKFIRISIENNSSNYNNGAYILAPKIKILGDDVYNFEVNKILPVKNLYKKDFNKDFIEKNLSIDLDTRMVYDAKKRNHIKYRITYEDIHMNKYEQFIEFLPVGNLVQTESDDLFIHRLLISKRRHLNNILSKIFN